MPLAQTAPGIPVCLSSNPDGIALVERVAGKSVAVRLQDGSSIEAQTCYRFFDHEVTGAALAFAALSLAAGLERTGKPDYGAMLRQAVGHDLEDLSYLKKGIARSIVIAVWQNRDTARKVLGDLHGDMMTSVRHEAGLPEDADLDVEAARLASDDSHGMPPVSWPGRDDPRAASKDRAVLNDGVLPNRRSRSFFCGAYDVDSGEIVEVRSYAETGYGELHHGEYFSRGVAARIDRGLYGYFVAHENGNVYAHWRVARGSVAVGAYAFLASQFTVDGKSPQIFEEMQRAAGEIPWYMRRTDPENDKSWEPSPRI